MSPVKHPLVLVGFEPDWEALYVNGFKVEEGHHVDKAALVTAGAVLAPGSGEVPTLETTHVESDEADQHGEHKIPTKLEDLPVGAYGRIAP